MSSIPSDLTIYHLEDLSQLSFLEVVIRPILLIDLFPLLKEGFTMRGTVENLECFLEQKVDLKVNNKEPYNKFFECYNEYMLSSILLFFRDRIMQSKIKREDWNIYLFIACIKPLFTTEDYKKCLTFGLVYELVDRVMKHPKVNKSLVLTLVSGEHIVGISKERCLGDKSICPELKKLIEEGRTEGII